MGMEIGEYSEGGRESLSIERNMAMTTDRTTQTGEPVVWVFNARETGVIV